ncbi:hypothetical protein TanjilG_32686 [Lupinus angustifolius]|uniref:Helicase ATP-binding domain-containing protein n=1 Tax=Lupinus angustifolius TaxID=3871 RepID=A0A1J7H509_LUPAN|nr:PREDICTED: DNA repair helicase XPD-like [Lupinus angustifolius]OIW07830.1 hypothetical protein TanjilG_32686 [Lupinus angustifolius]
MPTVTGKSIALLSLITSYGLSKSNSTLKVHYCTRTVHEMENTLAQLKLLHHYQDLRAFGKEKGWCPYFLTRHVCSLRLWWTGGYIYQYLLDPKMAGIISKEMQKESVVVFDEAHNMISMMFVLKHLL